MQFSLINMYLVLIVMLGLWTEELVAVVRCIFVVLLLLKLSEMLRDLFWVKANGQDLIDDLSIRFNALGESVSEDAFIDLFGVVAQEHNFPTYPGTTVLTGFIAKWYNIKRYRRLIGIAFTYFVLMLTLSFLNMLPGANCTRCGIDMILWSGMVIKTWLLVVSRYTYGPVESFFFAKSAQHLEGQFRLPLSRRRVTKYFAQLYLLNSLVMLFAFGSIYNSIFDHAVPHAQLYEAVQDNELSGLAVAFKSIYFSMVTLCTVGYGDIIPIGLLVIRTLSQMALGFSFFVLLISVFASSMDPFEWLGSRMDKMTQPYSENKVIPSSVLSSRQTNLVKPADIRLRVWDWASRLGVAIVGVCIRPKLKNHISVSAKGYVTSLLVLRRCLFHWQN